MYIIVKQLTIGAVYSETVSSVSPNTSNHSDDNWHDHVSVIDPGVGTPGSLTRSFFSGKQINNFRKNKRREFTVADSGPILL